MTLDDMPLFATLKAKLGYVSQRQRLIAGNVANADTPGYAPRDLKAFTFDAAMKGQAMPLTVVRTSAAHIAPDGGGSGSAYSDGAGPDSEVRLDGNQVVLEDQMMKMSQARMDYDAAIGLYQQSLTMLRTAARAPGK